MQVSTGNSAVLDRARTSVWYTSLFNGLNLFRVCARILKFQEDFPAPELAAAPLTRSHAVRSVAAAAGS
jgi:hypothetical protein